MQKSHPCLYLAVMRFDFLHADRAYACILTDGTVASAVAVCACVCECVTYWLLVQRRSFNAGLETREVWSRCGRFYHCPEWGVRRRTAHLTYRPATPGYHAAVCLTCE